MPETDQKAAEVLQKMRDLLSLDPDANRAAFDEALDLLFDAAGPAPTREEVKANAQREFQAHKEQAEALTSEGAYVALALQDAGFNIQTG